MQITFALRLPPEVESVPVVRSICRATMVHLGVDRRCVSDVALAVTEACANVVNHASGGNHEFHVEVELSSEECAIRVIDTGEGFDPREVPLIDDQAESGRGVHLMRALVDKLDFVPRTDRGTIVSLVKKLELRPDSPLRTLALR
jgi:serine/threonine-protein kinase RsbW